MKRFAPVFFALACGVAIGWLLRDSKDAKQNPPVDQDILTGDIVVMHHGDPYHPGNGIYRPHYYRIDGQPTNLKSPPSDESKLCVFSLANDRVIVGTTRQD